MRPSLLFLFGILFLSCFSQTSDKEITARLKRIQTEIPLAFNPIVRAQIADYQKSSKPSNVETIGKFLIFDNALKVVFSENKVPVELRYASISLTNFNLIEKGVDGKEGPFGLRHRIAIKNGLVITNYIDERRDVLKSAAVFCVEITRLYELYRDWRLALTAYNANEDDWLKAYALAGDARDYDTICSYLPGGAKNTYPHFVAATYCANFYKEMGYKTKPISVTTGIVSVSRYTTLEHLSTLLNVDYKLLKELNPTYKKYVIPQTTSLFYITIPSTRINHFYELGDEVYVYTAPPALPILEEKEKDTTVITPVIPHEDAPVVQSTTATVYYKVRKGDILLRIADLYDCEVNELRQWNNIRGNKIIVNQRLKIVVPSSKLSYYKKMDKLPKSELNRIMLKD